MTAEPSRFLTPAEREEIALGIARGETNTQIAARLGRHKSSIGREIDRTVGHALARDHGTGDVRELYRATVAQEMALERGKRPKPAKLETNDALRAQVESWLALNWSPKRISDTLVERFPGDPSMRISLETIYRTYFVS